MSKRILYFDFYGAATEFYRLLPLYYINHHDLSITRSTETNINFGTLCGYDAVIISRPSSAASLSLINLAKDMGIYVISDFDDDVLHLPNTNPMWEVYEREKAAVLECIAISDEIWVSTDGIRDSFRLFNQNIVVVPNGHDDYLFSVDAKPEFNYNKKAMYRGGHSHLSDMYDGETPYAVIGLVNTHPDWEFSFYGQRFEFLESRCGENYIAKGGASTIQFYKMMHKENACVFFYPLVDNLFNRSKSNCAFIESTYSGSTFFGVTDLPEFGKLSSTIFDFKEILNMFACGDAYMEQAFRFHHDNAWRYITDNLLVSQINNLRIERLLNI